MGSGYARLLRRIGRAHLLHSVLLELGFECNLRCHFCYNTPEPDRPRLTLEQYERLLTDLHDMQTLNLTLSGGEPLASPLFWPVARRARELGFVVRVKSNGHALTSDVARRLRAEADPLVVEISLHGATAATHDAETGVPGSFERLLLNLRSLRRIGQRVKLNALLTVRNEGTLDQLFALADDLGHELAVDPVVTPRDDGDRAPLMHAAGDRAHERLDRLLAERARRCGRTLPPSASSCPEEDGVEGGGGLCGAGAIGVAVNPYGAVFPCVGWRRPVGSLLERPIREIWEGSAGVEEIRDLSCRARRMLAGIPGGDRVRFCMGLAEQLTGDPLGLYPDVERSLAVVRSRQAVSDPFDVHLR